MKTQQKTKTEWKEVELGEIGEIVTGNTPPKNNPQNYGGSHPWIKPPNLDKEKYLYHSDEYLSDFGKENSRILPAGSVLVSCIGNLGKVGISGCNLSTNQQINSIIPQENISSEFLYYDLKKNQQKFESVSTNAVVPLLNKSTFSKIKIPLPFLDGKPDLETQKQIVAVLEKAEALKQKQKKVLELYDEYLKSVFWEMFYNKGFEEVNIGKEGLFEEIFAGGDVQKVNYSKSKTLECNIPIFTNGEKDKGFYGYADNARVKKPSITISARGTIGYTEIRKENFYPAIRLIVITPKEEIFSLEYLKYAINIINFNLPCTSIPQLTIPMIKSYKIPLPPLPLQQKFANIVEKVEKLKEKQKKSLADAEELFNVFMQKAFRGELS